MHLQAKYSTPQLCVESAPISHVCLFQDVEEQLMFGANSEMAYALSVEQSNGRWAMVGFLAAVLVEAGTGNGILGQLIMWFKITGFLGADSGF